MALFCQNICRFNRCGLHFATLYDLIQHIEETHINCDPEFLLKQEQQQPNCVALSYVYKVFREPPERKPKPIVPEPMPMLNSQGNIRKKASSNFLPGIGYRYHQEPPVNRVVGPNPSFPDERDTWDEPTAAEMHPSVVEEILNSPPVGPSPAEERKFKCPVSGCGRTYKNLNGMRYHTKIAHQSGNEHQAQGRIYRCHCGKEYKTASGLQHHSATHRRPSNSVPASPGSQHSSPGGSSDRPNRPPLFIPSGSQSGSAAPSPAQSPAPATSAAALAGGHQYHQPPSPAPALSVSSFSHQQSRNLPYHQIHRSGGGSGISAGPGYSLSSGVSAKRTGVTSSAAKRNYQSGKLMLNSTGGSAPNLQNAIQISDIIVTERN